MKNYKHILFGLAAIVMLSACGGDDDNDSYDDVIGVHNQGKNCKSCHSEFTVSGTIFTTLNAADKDANNAAAYHTLKLALEEGTEIVLYKGYGTGNARTKANTSAVGAFTAQVLDANGVVVNSSKLLSHDGDMLDCNACHTSTGLNGAPGRIVNSKQ